jgi:hypothetical protein
MSTVHVIDSPVTVSAASKSWPVWKRTPCLSWCTAQHRDDQHPSDRQCHSRYRSVGLTMLPAVQAVDGWMLETIRVCLEMMPGEVEPHAVVCFGEGNVADPHTADFSATLDEAEHLAGLLWALVALGRPDDEQARTRAEGVHLDSPERQEQRETPVCLGRPCAPWCVASHHTLDAGSARKCEGVQQKMELTMPDAIYLGGEQFTLDAVNLLLERNFRAAEAHLALYMLDGSGIEMALDETVQVAENLDALVALGRTDAESAR